MILSYRFKKQIEGHVNKGHITTKIKQAVHPPRAQTPVLSKFGDHARLFSKVINRSHWAGAV
jgi:hypothetical protein